MRTIIVISIVVSLAACAGMQQHSIGLPATAAPRFFVHLESVAQSRGMMISRHRDSLHVRTAQGDWLQYMVQQDQINLVLLPNTKGLSPEQIRQRQARLKALSDELVESARAQAKQAWAFE
jgi:hypothetical protein